MTDLPIVITAAGAQPQAPAALLAQLIAAVTAVNPGYTANLPGSLIEDISSTDVAAVAQCDSAAVETINSLTPFGANAFLLLQLGNIYGVPLGQASNTSVNVIFSGPAGYPIAQGFTVGDGTYQYVVQDGGIIGQDGLSDQLFCVAIMTGSWVVPVGTVTELITSVPATIDLSVTNPVTGTPGTGVETQASYRADVLQAGLAASQGMSRYLKTLLRNVPGVQTRLVSARQVPNNGGWEMIVGGGDPFQVAYAIFTSLFDISSLVGSTLAVTNITNANPGVVTTNLNHGFTTGQVGVIEGVVGMSGVNNVSLTLTVLTEKTFSIGISTISSGAYASGGVVTPNLRNIAPQIQDYPDIYSIPIVRPPQQSVVMTITWNTTAVNFVLASSVAQLVAPAIADYINNLSVGQPINEFVMDTVFQTAVANILPAQLLTRILYAISINGVSTPVDSGTGIVEGDPESYFFTSASSINVIQG